MAKRKITYDDGTSEIQDIPEAESGQAAMGYQKQLADAFAKSPVPKVGNPDVGGQSQTQAFRSAGPEGKWDQLKSQMYPLGSAVQTVGGIGALVGPGNSPDKRASGASDILRGGGALAAPLVLPGAIAASPLTAGAGIAGGMGSQGLAQSLLDQNRSLGPGTKNLMADIAGLMGGGLAGGATKLGLSGLMKLTKGPLGLASLIAEMTKRGTPATATAVPEAAAATPKPTLPKGAVLAGEAPEGSVASTVTGSKAPNVQLGGRQTPFKSPPINTTLDRAQQDMAQKALQEFVNRTKAGTLGQLAPQGAPAMNVGPQGPLNSTNVGTDYHGMPTSLEQVSAILQSLKSQPPQ